MPVMSDVEFLPTGLGREPGQCDVCGTENLATVTLTAVFDGGVKDYGEVMFCVECDG